MHHRYLLLCVILLLLASPAAAVVYDNTLTVSFSGYDDSSPVQVYPNGSTVVIPYGSTVWIGATQYPGGTWDTTVPNLYLIKPSGKEIVQLNFGNVQGLFSITYHVPSVYYTNGAPQTITLQLNVGDVGGDSYQDSIYAKYPNQYTLIFSDAYPIILNGGTTAQFTFGNPYDAPYIRLISVTTNGAVIPQNAEIVMIPQKSANPIPTPAQPYTALYDMKVENIPTSSIEEVDFLFGVPVGVVTDAGFDPRYDIELLRYTNAWEKLETSYVWEGEGQQAGMDWYAAKSPGFSYYAVGFAENVTKLPAEVFGTPTPTATTEVVTQPTTVPTRTASVPTPPQESSSFMFAGIFVLGAAAAVLLRR
ncbi:hypothetical protein McpSp1_02360 [Methanocorpusculaceae archaeon Sp1]|nr:hypothetical protein [Methanocorpusculaceae archaeon Sp1]